MFEGSQHHDKGYFPPLQGAGASLNGSTNADRTNYWEVVPSNALELALWMESDRMGFLLPALTDAKFSNQRDVVLNERRQNYENRPYGLAPMAMLAALFPPDHPYHWTTIGEIADLHAATLDEVREFFSTYYHPANASLALAGDIDPEEALDLVRARTSRICAPGRRVAPVRPADAALDRRDSASCSRIASSCRGSISRGCRRRCSPTTTPSSIWRPTSWPTARRRGCIAGWSTTSGSRPTCRRRRTRARSPGSCRSRRPRRPGTRSPSSSGSIVEEIARLARRRADRRRDRARPRAGRGAVRVPAADRRRLRRQVRSAERLQHVPRRSRLTSTAISSAISRSTRESLQAGRRAAISITARRVALSIVPRGRDASLGDAGLDAGAASSRRCRSIAAGCPCPGRSRRSAFRPSRSRRCRTACASGPSAIRRFPSSR